MSHPKYSTPIAVALAAGLSARRLPAVTADWLYLSIVLAIPIKLHVMTTAVASLEGRYRTIAVITSHVVIISHQ